MVLTSMSTLMAMMKQRPYVANCNAIHVFTAVRMCDVRIIFGDGRPAARSERFPAK